LISRTETYRELSLADDVGVIGLAFTRRELGVRSQRADHRPGASDMARLEALASHAAIAIVNARL
jgi:hypothetical protein